MAKNLAKLLPKLNDKELSWVGFILSNGTKYNGDEVPDVGEVMFRDVRDLASRLNSGHYESYDAKWGPSQASLKQKVAEYVKKELGETTS